MKYVTENIGKKIKLLRSKFNYTQDNLGKLIGVSGKQISNYEKGVLAPPIDILFLICDVFNCELGYLLDESDYSEGTVFQTKIYNKYGLTPEAIESIRIITGSEKDCLNFGYESDVYRKILSSLISSRYFPKLISEMRELGNNIEFSKKEMDEFKKRVGNDEFNKIIELYKDSSLDFNEIEDVEILNLMKQFDNIIDNQAKYQHEEKVSRYIIFQTFTKLIDDLFIND